MYAHAQPLGAQSGLLSISNLHQIIGQGTDYPELLISTDLSMVQVSWPISSWLVGMYCGELADTD